MALSRALVYNYSYVAAEAVNNRAVDLVSIPYRL